MRRLPVVPLSCPSCGGQVPLGEERTTRCPYCAAEVALPSVYLALREAERTHAASARRAAQLYARLGEPPGRALRFWAGGGTLLLWLMLIVSPASLLLWIIVLSQAWRLAPALGFQPVDVIGGVPLSLLLGVTILVVVVWPVLRVRAARDLARTRRLLQAALSARMPELPSAPFICRSCGAPLELGKALGVRCLYCHAHNLVALSADWVRPVERASKRAVVGLSKASAEERKQRRAVSRRTRRWFKGSAAILFVLSLASSVLSSGPSYRDHRNMAVAMLYSKDQYQPEITHEGPTTLTFTSCGSGCCGIEYLVALERGETSRFESLSDEQGALAIRYWAAYVEAPIHEAPFSASKDSEFVAPWSGWFNVRLELSGECRRDRKWRLRWRRESPRQ